MGPTFITALMIGRHNVAGGESSVYAEDGDSLVTTTLTEPGDILLSDDRRTLQESRRCVPAHRGAWATATS